MKKLVTIIFVCVWGALFTPLFAQNLMDQQLEDATAKKLFFKVSMTRMVYPQDMQLAIEFIDRVESDTNLVDIHSTVEENFAFDASGGKVGKHRMDMMYAFDDYTNFRKWYLYKYQRNLKQHVGKIFDNVQLELLYNKKDLQIAKNGN